MFASLRSLIVAGLVLAAALSATILTSGPPKDPPPAPRPAASVAELTDRLQPLGLRVVLPPAGDDPDRGVFLTTTDKSRRELAAAIPGDETARGVKEWAGTLRVHLLTRWNGDEHGTALFPFDSVAEGVDAVPPFSSGVEVLIAADTYVEGAQTFTTYCVLVTQGGTVTLR